MSFADLQDYMLFLKKRELLIEVDEPVSTYLEMTEIHRRVLHKGGAAILFRNVMHGGKKNQYPVLVNLFGTKDRISLGLGMESTDGLKDLGEKLAFLRQPEPPSSFKEAIGLAPLIKDVLSMKPKIVKKAACQEVVMKGDDVDLGALPIQTCWPGEPAPLVTWSMVVTREFDTESYNVGIYRLQVLGKNRLIVRWLDHRGGADHYRSYKRANQEEMPIAIVVGSDPATIIASVTPVPESFSEYEFAGLLRKKKLSLVRCKTNDLLVPSNAEFVIEGYVSMTELAEEGPYGDHTGYYNAVEQFPVVHVTAITTKKEAVYLSTYTGRPPDEPAILGEALNDVFMPLLQKQIPEIVDFYLPPEGCSYRIGVISIKKGYPGHAKKVMLGVWSALRQFMYTKFLIVVEEGVNIRCWQDVMWAVSTKMDFARDVTIITDTPIDYLDFASPEPGLGAKIGFDATDKIYPETKREWGREIRMPDDLMESVTKKWDKYFS